MLKKLSIVLVFLCSLSVLQCEKGLYEKNKPNIIFIMMDTIRQDSLSLYGYERETSPNLKKLAEDSVVFNQAIAACSWTSPSIASFFTGLYPSVHGVIGHYERGFAILPDTLETFQEVLKTNGYETAAFIANGWINPSLNFLQGFDVYDPVEIGSIKPLGSKLNRKAIAWLEERKGINEPFYLYLHYFDAHGPYFVPEPYNSHFKSNKFYRLTNGHRNWLGYLLEKDRNINGKVVTSREIDGNNLYYYIDHYDNGIRFNDAMVGNMIQYLKDAGLYEESVIVLVADHGEAFFDHGVADHGNTLYREEIVVPMMIKFPRSMTRKNKGLDKGLESTRVNLIDIPPTVLSLIGVEFPYTVHGKNLLEVKTENQKNRIIFSEELSDNEKGKSKIAVYKDHYKGIYRPGRKMITEIYDLSRDPLERNNIIGKNFQLAAQLKHETEKHLKESTSLKEKLNPHRPTIQLDEKQKEKLKSLGYL